MEEFIYKYGYWAVFFGSCIEGESVILTAGYFCAKGILSLPKIILLSFMGTLLADQGLYFFGRNFGMSYLKKRPHIQQKTQKIFDLLHRYDNTFIMSFRFIYGIRNITPIIIGASGFPVRRFVLLNLIAAALWAVIVCTAGYVFGEALQPVLHYFDDHPEITWGIIISVILLIVMGIYGYRFYKKKSD